MTPASPLSSSLAKESPDSSKPLIWLWDLAGPLVANVQPSWLAAGPAQVWMPGNLPEESHGLPQIGQSLQAFAAEHPQQGLWLLSKSTALQPGIWSELQQLAARLDGPAALTVLSNCRPEFNPFHNLPTPATGNVAEPEKLVALLGSRQLLPVDAWPQHLLYLSPDAVLLLADAQLHWPSALARLQDGGGQLVARDDLFMHQPGEELLTRSRRQPHEQERVPAWAGLSTRLAEWLAQWPAQWPALAGQKASATLPVAAWHPHAPATLHITHSWGGGVARWVSNFIDGDADERNPGVHLQLRSEGAESGGGAGQKLALYAGNDLQVPLASWWLHPVIRSTLDSHTFYRQIVQQVCARHGVGRVIVSSLVGHCLDALRTGLPTVQVLHDYYPLWPLLDVNPLPYLEGPESQAGAAPLVRAVAKHRFLPDFGDRDAAGWQTLSQRWRETLLNEKVKLAAPSQSVVQLLRRLDPDWNGLEIQVIPHGLPAFSKPAVVLPKARQDGRLRLVIPGRMQAGKGQALLLEALPELRKVAQVYLLGTGKDGEAFFGQSGVNVILQYQREDLPAILHEIGPHVAALLSVVPETFSYTLSEMRQLNIPVIATRVGSLAERVDDGRNGWLIATHANELVARVQQLAAQPGLLESMRQHLQQMPAWGTAEMLQAYQRLCPLPPNVQPTAAGVDSAANLDGLQRDAAGFQANAALAGNRQLRQQVESLQAEVDKRTAWAREREAARQAEQGAKEKWVKQLQQEIDTRSAELAHEQGKVAGLEHQYATILQSSSWRLTKPLRAARRVASNLKRAHAWDPRRWPLLLSQAVRTVSTSGLRAALLRVQLSPQQLTEPVTALDIELESIGDPTPPPQLPHSDRPLASIIIPVFNKWAYTAACLRSLANARNRTAFEVILVDDHSRDETAELARGVQGLHYLRNAKNLGFVGSCNRGLEVARGEFTVLLNNDTQVLDGWLDALLDTFEQFPDTGLCGAMLLYPDGSLQEAGGIIFSDGSGWNYGKHDDAGKPEYRYSREVDYCSGACVALRTSVFRQLEGFDARYAPAYYEDTDLAFRVRAAGLKVRYQPAARIIHHEGITSGTDVQSGAKRYQEINRSKFLLRWAAELAKHPLPIVNPDNRSDIRRARDHRLLGRVLIIDAYTPEPDQDSGSVRLVYLMQCLQALGYGVSFFADNRGFAGKYSEALQAAGVEVLYNPWIASLQDFFRDRGPEFDFVMVSRHYVAANYLALVSKYCPQAKFIFDTVDLHYLREERLAELEDSLPLRRVAAQTRRAELAVIRQSDITLVVSPVEQTVLREAAPEARVEILSNIHRVQGCQAGFAARKDLFFVGGYQHPPNIDAAQWFVGSIWPLVRAQLPGVNFHLIGSKAPERVRALQGNGVIFHGFVESLEPWLEGCRLAVAPLRYGAGVKGKVNMSMSHGQPVVATPPAVEGLNAVDGEDVLVATTAEEFASAVVRLYSDQALWEKLSAGGLQNVQRYFSLDTARAQLAHLLAIP